MILRLLKSNRTSNLLLYPVIGALLWLKSLLSPFLWSGFHGETDNLLYRPLHQLLAEHSLISVASALTLIVLMAVLVQQINDSYAFIRIRTKLPGALFVILVSGLPELHTMHPIYPATLFLLLALERLFELFDQKKAYATLFNAGLFLGIGSLFHFNLVFLLPAFLAGIIILCRDYQWREFVIMLLGHLLPLVFAAGYLFFTDQTEAFVITHKQNFWLPVNYFQRNSTINILLLLIGFLIIIGSIKIIRQFDGKKLSTRKYFTVFLILFSCSLATLILIPSASIEVLVFMSIPVTYLLSNLFVFIRSRFWSELLFILLLVVVVINQFELNLF